MFALCYSQRYNNIIDIIIKKKFVKIKNKDIIITRKNYKYEYCIWLLFQTDIKKKLDIFPDQIPEFLRQSDILFGKRDVDFINKNRDVSFINKEYNISYRNMYRISI